MTHSAATLEFREATKRYPGQDQPAVDALSLEVPAGEICVLVGPSGCGKTTAMRMVNRMTDITEGDILLDGTSVRERRPAALRREIGYAIQQIGLFPHQTVADNVATVPKLLGWSKDRIRARVDELLELVSLDPHETRDRYPAQLSGGQRQRVGVARALAVDPPLMLMDEPFGAIDPINRERLQNEFLRLQKEIRKTIVFVTHDIDEAIKMGDKIAILQKGGKLAQYAPPAELLMYPKSKFVEDFVGADRALKRLALQRVRDIDLWKVAKVRAGEPVPEARAKLRDADISIPLLVDEGSRPVGWLSEEGLAGERVQEIVRSKAEPVIDLDNVLRDALANLLVAETQYAPVVDAGGKVAGVLSLEVIGHFLHEAPAESRTGAELVEEPRVTLDLIAQLEIRERSGAGCVAENGFCPQWIADNWDRYVDPFWQHVFLTLAPVAIGFAIAFTVALIAHRRRWLIGPIAAFTGALYTIPSVAFFFLLQPLTGRGNATALVALVCYTLLIIFRNVITGLGGVPEESKDAARGMGLTERQLLWRVEMPLALPEILAGLRIATTTTVGLAALAFLAGAGGLGAVLEEQPYFKSNVAVAGGLCVLLAAVLDLVILAVQRALTPWRRAASA